jgi:hypothetical protein
MAWSLYPQGNSSWYPLDKRLGGPQSRSGRGGEEKNSHPLTGLKVSIIQPVAQRYTTELSRLLVFPNIHYKMIIDLVEVNIFCKLQEWLLVYPSSLPR